MAEDKRSPGRFRPVTAEIITLVCEYYRLGRDEFLGPYRYRRLAWPRQVAFLLIHRHTQLSLSEIGRRIGGRDHSTVSYGIEQAEARCRDDPSVQRDLDDLERWIFDARPKFIRHNAAHVRPFASVRRVERACTTGAV